MSIRVPTKRAAQSPERANGAPVDVPVCKPYLSISELAQLTPWTDQAIRTMISRGVFREREHFFYVGRCPVLNGRRLSASSSKDRHLTVFRTTAIS
jgi:hypothetical protein